MAQQLSQPVRVNVLLSDAQWEWPRAVEQIFQPRGINALVADSPNDILKLVTGNKIHLAIIDAALDNMSGVHTLRVIRQQDKLLPCILLANADNINRRVLEEALGLGVFSVIGKPVNLGLLANQIDKLFVKYYGSNMFSTKIQLGQSVSISVRHNVRMGNNRKPNGQN